VDSEVGRCIDRARIVVLIQCTGERGIICGITRSLFVFVRVVQVIFVLVLLLAPYSPCHESESTNECCTNDSNYHPYDCVLRRLTESRATRAAATAIETCSGSRSDSSCGDDGYDRARGTHRSHGLTASIGCFVSSDHGNGLARGFFACDY